jgi:hypothetical protein
VTIAASLPATADARCFLKLRKELGFALEGSPHHSGFFQFPNHIIPPDDQTCGVKLGLVDIDKLLDDRDCQVGMRNEPPKLNTILPLKFFE